MKMSLSTMQKRLEKIYEGGGKKAIQKQKERLLRDLKRAETQLRNAKDELSSANMTIEKLELKVNLNYYYYYFNLNIFLLACSNAN